MGLKSLKKLNLRNFDAIKFVNKIPNKDIRLKALDTILSIGIPFNRGIGLKIKKLTPENVIVESRPNTRRQNHVGTTHAVGLALMGEYAAGLLVAQHFSFESYRIIISELHVQYEKPGVGTIRSTVVEPHEWPLISIDGEAWVELSSQIFNAKSELVATIKTKWQVKEWSKVKGPRT